MSESESETHSNPIKLNYFGVYYFYLFMIIFTSDILLIFFIDTVSPKYKV